MDTLVADFRYALRKLVRAPGFTFVALLTLALGIGANSAIFSVVYGVLFRPLPFPESEQLVRLDSEVRGNTFSAYSGPTFVDVQREMTDVFSAVSAHTTPLLTLTGAGEPVELEAAAVSASFFDVVGVRPALGRGFRPDENESGNHRVAVLSHGLWQQRFGGDEAIIGQTITLQRSPYEVVGVMPPGFDFPGERSLWVPLEYTPSFTDPENRGGFFLTAYARMRPGVEFERADAALRAFGRRIDQEWVPADGNDVQIGTSAVMLREALIGDVRTPLLVLLGAVGFVLLIACANVANLLLARASIRETEMAVRAAMGAGRVRIVRQLVTESVVLGVLGGVLGLVLALWGSAALVQLQPGNLPRMAEVRVDGAVVLFTLGISILAGLLFGILPAFQTSRISPYNALREGGRGAIGQRRGQRVRAGLIIAEIALAVLLLAGAGLLMRSFATLIDVDPGFRSHNVAAFRVGLPNAVYADDERRALFYEQLLERVHTLPGVQSAGAINMLPLSTNMFRIGFNVQGRPPAPATEEQVLDVRVATPGYLETLGIPVRRGRGIEPTDRQGTLPVLLINEAAVQRYFPDEDPIGKTIELGWGRSEHPDGVSGTVVGVVGDVKLQSLGDPASPTVYVPHAQVAQPGMFVTLRTEGDPLGLTARLRDELAALDPNLPLDEVTTLQATFSQSVAEPRFYMALLLIFAAVALVLAAVGIFGVMSFAVAQRRREIGIRMALGAEHASVLRMVVGQALTLTAIGIAIGLVAALGLTRWLESLLYGVAATDALALFGAVMVLGATSFAASYLPARRAASMDPLMALRAD